MTAAKLTWTRTGSGYDITYDARNADGIIVAQAYRGGDRYYPWSVASAFLPRIGNASTLASAKDAVERAYEKTRIVDVTDKLPAPAEPEDAMTAANLDALASLRDDPIDEPTADPVSPEIAFAIRKLAEAGEAYDAFAEALSEVGGVVRHANDWLWHRVDAYPSWDGTRDAGAGRDMRSWLAEISDALDELAHEDDPAWSRAGEPRR